MVIHIVQPGDTIQSIADYYGVSPTRIIENNGLENPDHLVIGQSIVIAIPELTYTVKEGDSLSEIADYFQVTVIQLLSNNPSLSNSEYIFPGDVIVIKYPTKGSITTHGNTVPYINRQTLRRTLPYLTYLSVLNYTATQEGEIITYYDDTEIIQAAKDYGVMPLMLLTTLTIQGRANLGVAFDLLLNPDFQDAQIENILKILKLKGYYGINISFEHISASNLYLYEEYFVKVSNRLGEEGFQLFVTITPNLTTIGEDVEFVRVNYSLLNHLANNIIFMDYQWAININPPSPISSIYHIDVFINYIKEYIPSDKVIIGMPTIGYDWELPYSAGLSSVNSLTLTSAIDLARNVGAAIQFDDTSQTPFYTYTTIHNGVPVDHIVWFIDARSINALLDLIYRYELQGAGIGNLSIYNTQLWFVIYSQYEIAKVILTP